MLSRLKPPSRSAAVQLGPGLLAFSLQTPHSVSSSLDFCCGQGTRWPLPPTGPRWAMTLGAFPQKRLTQALKPWTSGLSTERNLFALIRYTAAWNNESGLFRVSVPPRAWGRSVWAGSWRSEAPGYRGVPPSPCRSSRPWFPPSCCGWDSCLSTQKPCPLQAGPPKGHCVCFEHERGSGRRPTRKGLSSC